MVAGGAFAYEQISKQRYEVARREKKLKYCSNS